MTRLLSACVLIASLAAATLAQDHDHPATSGERLGTVHFETSCGPAVRAAFDRGVALLHSFWYANAEQAFGEIAKQDPTCAMAHWGIAMAAWGNPLGGTRTPAIMERGRAAIARAKAIAAKT